MHLHCFDGTFARVGFASLCLVLARYLPVHPRPMPLGVITPTGAHRHASHHHHRRAPLANHHHRARIAIDMRTGTIEPAQQNPIGLPASLFQRPVAAAQYQIERGITAGAAPAVLRQWWVLSRSRRGRAAWTRPGRVHICRRMTASPASATAAHPSARFNSTTWVSPTG